MKCLYAISIAALLVAVTAESAETWKTALQESLSSKYEMTKTGVDRVRVTKAGTLLMIRKENISGDPASDLTYLNNKVIDGTVQQAGGFSASLQDKKTSRVFRVGEKVYLFKIDVKDDRVEYFVLSGETYDVNLRGSTRQTRYKSLISFEFPKGFLETADTASVKKAIDEVLAPEAIVTAARTVELGQSPQQVEAALGKPETVVNLGAKVTYVYKIMKVVFQDGKVVDVQ